MTASEEDGIIVVESDDMSVGGDRTACTEAAAAPPPISPYNFTASAIDALLGEPALLIGEDMAQVRALENALYNDMADPTRPQSYVDIRAKASAIREAAQLERDRAYLLNEAIKGEILVTVSGAAPHSRRQCESLLAARSIDRAKLDRLLAKAGLALEPIAAKATARVRLQCEAISVMIDRAYKKARDAEAHGWRREDWRIRLRLMRKKAQDANALGAFD